jgi:hypothetical protein
MVTINKDIEQMYLEQYYEEICHQDSFKILEKNNDFVITSKEATSQAKITDYL